MKTNKEIILSHPGLEDTPDSFVEKIMLDRSVAGTEEYNSNDKNIALCAADLYLFMANSPDFTDSKLSMTYSRDAFIKTAKRLYIENGEAQKANSLTVKIIGRAKTTH